MNFCIQNRGSVLWVGNNKSKTLNQTGKKEKQEQVTALQFFFFNGNRDFPTRIPKYI